MKKKDRNNLIVIGIFILLFVIVTMFISNGLTKDIDNSVYSFIISFRCNFLDNYFKLITKLGNFTYIIIVLGICVLFIKNKYVVYLCLSMSLSVIFNYIIKHIIKRDRPNVLRLISQGGYSYPSGHTMISLCCYGYLFYYVYKYVKNKYLRISLLVLLSLIIISIPISRIYVGVHYFSDIVGGLLLGGVILFIVIRYGKYIIRGN